MNSDRTDEFDDRPMTEAEWEQSMRESEARSAKFGELLETLIDHPERDAIISREMGWDRDESDAETAHPAHDVPDLNSIEPTMDESVELKREEQALEEILAYTRSREWAMTVWRSLKNVEAEESSLLSELLQEAIGGSMSVSVKIAGGHGMGYDEQALCGNIVRCRKALEAADESLRALRELQDDHGVPSAQIEPLLLEGLNIKKSVEERIVELRKKVWWD